MFGLVWEIAGPGEFVGEVFDAGHGVGEIQCGGVRGDWVDGWVVHGAEKGWVREHGRSGYDLELSACGVD